MARKKKRAKTKAQKEIDYINNFVKKLKTTKDINDLPKKYNAWELQEKELNKSMKKNIVTINKQIEAKHNNFFNSSKASVNAKRKEKVTNLYKSLDSKVGVSLERFESWYIAQTTAHNKAKLLKTKGQTLSDFNVAKPEDLMKYITNNNRFTTQFNRAKTVLNRNYNSINNKAYVNQFITNISSFTDRQTLNDLAIKLKDIKKDKLLQFFKDNPTAQKLQILLYESDLETTKSFMNRTGDRDRIPTLLADLLEA